MLADYLYSLHCSVLILLNAFMTSSTSNTSLSSMNCYDLCYKPIVRLDSLAVCGIVARSLLLVAKAYGRKKFFLKYNDCTPSVLESNFYANEEPD